MVIQGEVRKNLRDEVTKVIRYSKIGEISDPFPPLLPLMLEESFDY